MDQGLMTKIQQKKLGLGDYDCDASLTGYNK